jgi:hypothetical protein
VIAPIRRRTPRNHGVLRRGLSCATVLLAGLVGAGVVSVSTGVSRAGEARHAAATPGCDGMDTIRTIAGTVCVHGEDDGFPTAAATGSSTAGDLTARRIPCHGDGNSGKRIAFYYAYLAGHPDRASAVRRQLRQVIEQANDIVYRSARQQSGKRWLRVLTDKRCRPVVRSLELPHKAADSFGETINAAQRAGLDAKNRKYVLFVDADNLCGIATLLYDEQPTPDNLNNAGPSWARVDSGCWSAEPTVHEIFHMLGAVEKGAPHYDDTGHCTDDRDVMCYQSPGGKRVRIRCHPWSEEERLDCGKNDYFNIAPRNGSYLAKHWNTARSSFLYGGGPAA